MQNLDKKENMIMRDGEFVTMIQQQEEEKVNKSMEKEQKAMSSTSTGKYLLASFSSVFHTPELGRRLKSNNLSNGQYAFIRGSFTSSTSGI